MASEYDLNRGWSATAAGTNAGATATKSAITGSTIVVTHVSGHTDTDATLQLKDGSTVLAEWKIDISLEGFQFMPQNGVWPCTPGSDVTAVISASTSDCQVNMAGFAIP